MDEITRLELEALKNVIDDAARKLTPDDVPIAFSDKGIQRVGKIIAATAHEKRKGPSEIKSE